MVAEVIFIASVTIIAYTYVGYAVLVYGLSLLFGRSVRSAPITPKVSVIIAARNEERDIAAKLENTLALDYPEDKLEVIVASDCSTDRTDKIVRRFNGRGVVLHRQGIRLGKTAAQNQAVQLATGEILMFSDATTRLNPDAVKTIVRSFADSGVGCVAGQLVYADASASGIGQGCRHYWDWEKQIRQCESRLGSLIGVSGCLYAVRRCCHSRLAADMIDDFAIVSEIHLQGLRTVYEPEALAIERTNRHAAQEFRMRVRVIEQTMSVFYRYRRLVSPQHGMFGFQLVSHKLLRYIAPVFLITAYLSNLFILNISGQYILTFVGMSLLYSAAFKGWTMDRRRQPMGPLTIPYYFALANVASIVALIKFVSGESRIVWEPIRSEGTTSN